MPAVSTWPWDWTRPHRKNRMARLSRSSGITAPPYRTVLRVERLNFPAEGKARICAIIVGVRSTRVTDRRSIARSASSGSNSGCRTIVAPT